MLYLIHVVIAIVAYLIGSVNFSILLSRAVSGEDIRTSGSGNAGATNMLRTHGKKLAVITLLLDIAKGVLAVLLAVLYVRYINAPERYYEWGSQSDLAMYRNWISDFEPQYISGLFVIIGHCFPVFFGFKGGKGVATALGVVITLDWKIGIIVLVVALAIMVISRYVSLGSVVAAALFMVLIIVKQCCAGNINTYIIVCSALMGLLIILRHYANISRLINGTENKLSMKKKEMEE